MRIGMMADAYKPHVSGITNHIALSKSYLEKAGHEVFIFTFGDEDYADDEPNVVRSPGVPLVDTGYYVTIRHSSPAQKLLRTMDIIHVHHPFLSGRLALRYCQPFGLPIVFTNHTRYDLYAQAYLPALPEVISETFLQAYLPNFCNACDLVIAPSPGIHQVLKRFGVEKNVEVVPNGVELSPYRREVEPIARAGMGFSESDVLLIYTGRLAPEKNLPFLLKAFSGLARTYQRVGLMVVGGGPDREDLEERIRYMGIAERVYFSGLVPYDRLPAYLAAADIFVTASVSEVHPLSVIEAMAAGLPVLGIHSPGIGDTVEDGVSGLLASEVDVAEFTAKMGRLVTERGMRQAMGEQARQAANAYAIERTTQIVLDHYEQLIESTADRKPGLRSRLIRLLDRLFK